jgi:general secretion pathway protein I
MSQHHCARGFTLLEVLVALVILAIALGAVIKVSGQSAQALQQMRGDTAATVIAQDLCARLQLSGLAPEIGTQNNLVVIEGQSWLVRQTVSAGQLPGVLKVSYFVKTPPPYTGQASITTYFYPPPAASSPTSPPPVANATANATANAPASAPNPSGAP